jgi:hypothetical protein|uniref:Uncharacterized protein n=1 Tax=Globisporangium ultimum (strain ATCC 200006 / CBS 805.95 / DAOM BR144) TaxID=431595 RepID=K3WCN1_GLOUD
MRQKHAARSKYLDDHLPFSLLRILWTVIAYARVLSDVLRLGIGVRNLSPHFSMVEPDSFLMFGPWSYYV